MCVTRNSLGHLICRAFFTTLKGQFLTGSHIPMSPVCNQPSSSIASLVFSSSL